MYEKFKEKIKKDPNYDFEHSNPKTPIDCGTISNFTIHDENS